MQSKYPIIDKNDFLEKDWKTLREIRYFRDIRRNSWYMIPFVRGSKYGTYIDLYFLMEDDIYRLVFCPDMKLSTEDEEQFFKFLHSHSLQCDHDRMQDFSEDVQACFPDIHFLDYDEYEWGLALEHIYNTMIRDSVYVSKEKEIFYKADLWRIARKIYCIPKLNYDGTTPEQILGMPLKLLRIFNQEEFVPRLFNVVKRKICLETYKTYANYIGKEMPTKNQWDYLEKLYKSNGRFATQQGFNRALYRKLSFKAKTDFVSRYEEFFNLYDKAYGKKPKLPDPLELEGMNSALKAFIRYNKSEECFEDILIKNREGDYYGHIGEQFSVLSPDCCKDLCIEAMAQENCLMKYINDHARSETTILFLRKTKQISKPFVTLEVSSEGVITQVYEKFNRLPSRSVFEFLEQYAEEKELEFCPTKLIFEDEVEMRATNYEDELYEYLRERGERS